MMIFGHTRSSDASTTINASEEIVKSSLFEAPSRSILISKLSVWADGLGPTNGDQTLIGKVHSDSGDLLGTTAPTVVANLSEPQWVDLTFDTALAIEEGDLYLGVEGGGPSEAARVTKTSTGTNLESFSAVGTFSPGSPSSGELAIFATYAYPWTPPDETDDYFATLAYNSAQAVLGDVAADPRSRRRVYATWHGTYLDPSPQGASLAIVQQGGELTDLVGERVRLTAPNGRSTAVYITKELDLDLEDDTQISITRRAWQALAPLPDDTLLVTCETIPGT